MTAARVLRQPLFAATLAAAGLALAALYHADAPLRSGIAFHPLAAVRELAKGEFPPRHNLIAGYAPQGHYGPYLVAVATVSRWTGTPPLAVLYAAGIAGLIAFLVLLARLTARHAGTGAARWSALAALLLWGPWPGPTLHWAAWGWPGTTSIADPWSFFYPQHAALVLLLLILLLVPAAGTLWSPRRSGTAAVLAALLVATHPLTGIPLTAALLARAVSDGVGGAGRWPSTAVLLLLPAAGLFLAALWPYYPVLGLLGGFTEPGINTGLASVAPMDAAAPAIPKPPAGTGVLRSLSILGPALVGLAGGALLWRRGERFPLLWAAAALVTAHCPVIPLHTRLLTFAAAPLHLGAAALFETAWRRGALGRVTVVGLLGLGATAAGMRTAWVLEQERPDLTLVDRHCPEDAVVLADPRTANAVAALTGRKVVAPEGPDLFLVLAGGWQRNVDVQRFLSAEATPGERAAILERWGVTHVLVDRLATPLDLPYPVTAEHGGRVLYRVSPPGQR